MSRKTTAVAVMTVLALSGLALADKARGRAWPEAFSVMNGQPLHRFTLTPDGSTAEDNTTAAGGTAVTYTLTGGERLCLQSSEAAYVEVIAAASMTAAGAKGFRLGPNEPLLSNCLTLKAGALRVSALCVSGNCTSIKGFELQ